MGRIGILSNIVGVCVVVFLLLVFSCGNPNSEDPKNDNLIVTPEKSVVVPSFNADSAYKYLSTQVAFGPRVPNSEAHTQCANYIIAKTTAYADTVYVQQALIPTYDGNNFEIKNIIASFNPENKNRVLLFAHWDTRPWGDQDTKDKDKPIDGANDGGSGVAVLLEVARVLANNKISIGLDLAFFDLEDYGKSEHEDSYGLGTQYWARNPHIKGYTANYGILLDMVGGKNAVFTQEGNSIQFAENIVGKVWAAATKAGYGTFFKYEQTNFITDDHYYVNTIANIPSIDIIQHDESTTHNFAPYWHTHSDNMESVDKQTLKAVGQTLLQTIYTEK